jgi:hypothetical protein
LISFDTEGVAVVEVEIVEDEDDEVMEDCE